jgi:hypothetical protein
VNTYGDRPYGHLALSYSEARRFSWAMYHLPSLHRYPLRRVRL